MTKKKPGAVRGRPMGSGAGFVLIGVRVLPEVKARIEKAAAARDVEPGVVARDVLTRWAKRQPKGGAR